MEFRGCFLLFFLSTITSMYPQFNVLAYTGLFNEIEGSGEEDICNPPCENRALCEEENECICPPYFGGYRCENECVDGWTKFLSTDNPNNNGIGDDDETLDKIRKMHPVCPGGIIKDIDCKAIESFVDYKELGLECSINTGFVCKKNERQKNCEDFAVSFLCECNACSPQCRNGGTCLANNTCLCAPRFEGSHCEIDICKKPPEPRNATMSCRSYVDINEYVCIAECEIGYHFPKGDKVLSHKCNARTKKWIPEYKFPDCEAECNPPCENGGTCQEGNVCFCTSEFEGDRCENAVCNPPCENGGSCEAGNVCICSPDFEGDACEKAVCNPPCQNGGSCEAGNICICSSGFEGDSCEEAVCNPPCQNGGSCEAGNVCICSSDFKGDACEKALCDQPCLNGGCCAANISCTCTESDRSRCKRDVCQFLPRLLHMKIRCSQSLNYEYRYTCIAECEDEYKFQNGRRRFTVHFDSRSEEWSEDFPDCEAKPLPSCHPPCQNGGTCEKGNQCLCPLDFDGYRCEIAVCYPPCENGGSCEAGNKCICLAGFEGERCEIAECYPPCENKGSCEAGNICICLAGFEGDRCENECLPQNCPPLEIPELEEGEDISVLTTNCCTEVQITCDPNLCVPPPNCSQGFKLYTEKGRCCLKQKCIPQDNVCVYQHRYDVVNGTQVKLPFQKFYDKKYQPGSSWNDGFCSECTCLDINGSLMTRCNIQKCPNPADFPDSEKYHIVEVPVPDSCCPKFVRKFCVDQGADYNIGDEWLRQESESCRTISSCDLDSTGQAIINVRTKCQIPCPSG